MGKLLWETTNTAYPQTIKDGGKYQKLAEDMKRQIEIGRASSSLVSANFDVVAAGITYVAIADPEPVSKAVAAVAAYAATKTGDYFSGVAMNQARDQAKKLLTRAVQDSGLSDTELESLKGDEVRKRVLDFKIGGRTIAKEMEDDPETLRMLQAAAVDISLGVGLKALKTADAAKDSVEQMKTELQGVRKQIEDYQEKVFKRLENVENRIGGLETATKLTNEKLISLETQVQGNAKAIETLAEISYSGWTTSQKLQAVRSGMFRELDEGQRIALEESLEADKAREDLVSDVQGIANGLADAAAIASHLGLPPDLVQGLQGAQIGAVALGKFASGDYLGAVSSVTHWLVWVPPTPRQSAMLR